MAAFFSLGAYACVQLTVSVNFAVFIRDFLVWPLFPTEGRPQELAPWYFRYTAAGGTLAVSALCAWYFAYAPSRMVTRMTLYPSAGLVGLRTAAPPPSHVLPAKMRRGVFYVRAGLLSPVDRYERLVPLEHVFRLQGSAVGSEMAEWNELVRRKVRPPPAAEARLQRFNATSSRIDQQDTLMMRVGDGRLAFQLSARPQRASLLHEPPPRGIGHRFHLMLRAPTDWARAAGYTASPAEAREYERRAARGTDTEPWFLDRESFDQLFPVDATRYQKT